MDQCLNPLGYAVKIALGYGVKIWTMGVKSSLFLKLLETILDAIKDKKKYRELTKKVEITYLANLIIKKRMSRSHDNVNVIVHAI